MKTPIPNNEEQQPEKSYLEKRREHIQNGRPLKEKKKYYIPKISKKRVEQLKAEKEARGDGDSDLQKWFKQRIKQLTGHCAECGAKVETKNYQYAILSVCHLLAKRDTVCPSVKIHPANWIELCPHHHDILDKSNWKEIELWGCWQEIRDRLILVYPDIDPAERRFFPESVLKFMQEKGGIV